MYQIIVAKSVKKFLEAHPKPFRKIIIELFDVIASDPFHAQLDVKPLVGAKNHFRLRVGKFRILYEVMKSEIVIYFYKADSRGDVYKN